MNEDTKWLIFGILARAITLMFWLVILVMLVAFLLNTVLSEDITGQSVRPTPPATSVPPPMPTSTSTPPTPTGDAPRMDVSCKEDRGTWLCTVWVYPGHIAGLEILTVHNYGTWIATFQFLGKISDGWGVAVRWAAVESCSTEFAELQLMEMDPPTARIQQVQGQPVSPTHARYSVSWHCNFLPEIR